MRRAVVVFQDSGGHWLSPLLKPGFRHCGIIIESNGYWVVVDPNPDGVRFVVLANMDFDAAALYENYGMTVVEIACKGTQMRAPAIQANCVGMVKAIIGLRKPFIFTPYQLYKYLSENRHVPT